MAFRWMGLHAGETAPLDRGQLERGLQYTSGRECLPLPLCIGQLLKIHEERGPGEIAGFYMLKGGAPCVLDAYLDFLRRFIVEQQLPDLFLFVPTEENGQSAIDRITLAKNSALSAPGGGSRRGDRARSSRCRRRRQRGPTQDRSGSGLSRQRTRRPGSRPGLAGFVEQIAALPRMREPRDCPRVIVIGDFFTRFSPFFMDGVRDLYAGHGIILKPVDMTDLLHYHTYYGVAETARGWGMKPGGLALAKACSRMFQRDGKQYLQHWLAYQAGETDRGRLPEPVCEDRPARGRPQ